MVSDLNMNNGQRREKSIIHFPTRRHQIPQSEQVASVDVSGDIYSPHAFQLE